MNGPYRRERSQASRRLSWGLAALLMGGMAWAQQAPPAPVAPPPPENIENMGSVGIFYWRTDYGAPAIRPGEQAFDPGIQTFDLPSKGRALGGEITIPAGAFNRLEISFFSAKDSGAQRVTSRRAIEGQGIAAGELVAAEYELRNLRASWNYLTFPVPPLDSRFRIKSFWEVQYTQLRPLLTFPERDEDIASSVDSEKAVVLPGVGLGFEYVPGTAFRIEGRASGMALPGRSRYLDAQLAAVVRLGGVEIFGGAKSYHFRTSLKDELVYKGTITGPFFGLRYVFPRR